MANAGNTSSEEAGDEEVTITTVIFLYPQMLTMILCQINADGESEAMTMSPVSDGIVVEECMVGFSPIVIT